MDKYNVCKICKKEVSESLHKKIKEENLVKEDRIKWGPFFMVFTLIFAPSADAIIDCSHVARMKAAQLHYKSGCYIAAISICSGLSELGSNNKYSCYEKSLIGCEVSGNKYKKWLEQK